MNKHLEELAPKTYIVSAACSTGKTHAACQHIAESGHLTNHIYIAPSLDLLKQTEATLNDMGVKPTVITSATHPKMSNGVSLGYLEGAEEIGEVALITWQAYADLPYFPRRSNWQPIIDEVPQLDNLHPWKLPRNFAFIRDRVLVASLGPATSWHEYRQPTVKSLRRSTGPKADDVDESFRSSSGSC